MHVTLDTGEKCKKQDKDLFPGGGTITHLSSLALICSQDQLNVWKHTLLNRSANCCHLTLLLAYKSHLDFVPGHWSCLLCGTSPEDQLLEQGRVPGASISEATLLLAVRFLLKLKFGFHKRFYDANILSTTLKSLPLKTVSLGSRPSLLQITRGGRVPRIAGKWWAREHHKFLKQS